MANYLRKRLTLELSQALVRDVRFWFVYEKTPKGRPHIHGSIAFSPQECEPVRLAMKKAAGKWEGEASQYQLIFTDVFFGEGWAQYVAKDVEKAWSVAQGHRVYAASQPLISAFKDYYELLKHIVTTLRERPRRALIL